MMEERADEKRPMTLQGVTNEHSAKHM